MGQKELSDCQVRHSISTHDMGSWPEISPLHRCGSTHRVPPAVWFLLPMPASAVTYISILTDWHCRMDLCMKCSLTQILSSNHRAARKRHSRVNIESGKELNWPKKNKSNWFKTLVSLWFQSKFNLHSSSIQSHSKQPLPAAHMWMWALPAKENSANLQNKESTISFTSRHFSRREYILQIWKIYFMLKSNTCQAS